MLNVGDKIPNFQLPLAFADGKKDVVEFHTLLGKGPVVIGFFPLAFTTPCTAEMCELRDHAAHFDSLHVTRVGFSVDTKFANAAFAKENNLKHGLFCDSNRAVVHQIWETGSAGGSENRAKRGWMVLDTNGVVIEKWVSDDPAIWSGIKPIEAALHKAK